MKKFLSLAIISSLCICNIIKSSQTCIVQTNNHKPGLPLKVYSPTFNKEQLHRILRNHDINEKIYGETMLICAAKVHNSAMVEQLLEYKADIEIKDDYGNTALAATAERRGYIDILNLLLANNADKNTQNLSGTTPLMQAIQSDFTMGADSLISHKADLNLQDCSGYTALMHAMQVTEYYWLSQIKLKLNTGWVHVVNQLLKAGANPDIPDNIGATALIKAAYHNNKLGVILLLHAGANPDIKTYEPMHIMHMLKKSKPTMHDVLIEQFVNTFANKTFATTNPTLYADAAVQNALAAYRMRQEEQEKKGADVE